MSCDGPDETHGNDRHDHDRSRIARKYPRQGDKNQHQPDRGAEAHIPECAPLLPVASIEPVGDPVPPGDVAEPLPFQLLNDLLGCDNRRVQVGGDRYLASAVLALDSGEAELVAKLRYGRKRDEVPVRRAHIQIMKSLGGQAFLRKPHPDGNFFVPPGEPHRNDSLEGVAHLPPDALGGDVQRLSHGCQFEVRFGLAVRQIVLQRGHAGNRPQERFDVLRRRFQPRRGPAGQAYPKLALFRFLCSVAL